MESGNSDLPEGWEIIPEYMTIEEKRIWECERNWKLYGGLKKKEMAENEMLKRERRKGKKTMKQVNKERERSMTYYQRKKEADKRPKLICIYGPSGSGKTAASSFLEREFGLNVICSYTTRPMRKIEKDGVSHHFVTEADMPPKDEMLAYTFFGGYHYWALKTDVKPPVSVYVIDEAGLNNLLQYKDIYRIIAVRIDCRETVRYIRGITRERIERDRERVRYVGRPFAVVDNNRTYEFFKLNLRRAYKRIMKL